MADKKLDHKRVYSGHFEPPNTSLPPFLIFLRLIQKSEISLILGSQCGANMPPPPQLIYRDDIYIYVHIYPDPELGV